jgi:hypothetical protein
MNRRNFLIASCLIVGICSTVWASDKQLLDKQLLEKQLFEETSYIDLAEHFQLKDAHCFYFNLPPVIIGDGDERELVFDIDKVDSCLLTGAANADKFWSDVGRLPNKHLQNTDGVDLQAKIKGLEAENITLAKQLKKQTKLAFKQEVQLNTQKNIQKFVSARSTAKWIKEKEELVQAKEELVNASGFFQLRIESLRQQKQNQIERCNALTKKVEKLELLQQDYEEFKKTTVVVADMDNLFDAVEQGYEQLVSGEQQRHDQAYAALKQKYEALLSSHAEEGVAFTIEKASLEARLKQAAENLVNEKWNHADALRQVSEAHIKLSELQKQLDLETGLGAIANTQFEEASSALKKLEEQVGQERIESDTDKREIKKVSRQIFIFKWITGILATVGFATVAVGVMSVKNPELFLSLINMIRKFLRMSGSFVKTL